MTKYFDGLSSFYQDVLDSGQEYGIYWKGYNIKI